MSEFDYSVAKQKSNEFGILIDTYVFSVSFDDLFNSFILLDDFLFHPFFKESINEIPVVLFLGGKPNWISAMDLPDNVQYAWAYYHTVTKEVLKIEVVKVYRAQKV